MLFYSKPTPKQTLFISIILLATLLSLLTLTSKTRPPKLISITPPNNTINVDLNSPITLTFSKPINPQNISLVSNPQENFVASQPKPNTLIFTHQLSFYQNKTYTIKIYRQNHLIYTLEFTTQKSQNEPRQLQLLDQEVKHDYPLAQFTPYQTNTFEVVYTAPRILQISTAPKYAGLKSEIIQQVKDWVKQHGYDPDSHQYVFKVLKPHRSTL